MRSKCGCLLAFTISGFAVLTIFYIFALPPAVQAFWYGSEGEYFDSDGARMHYTELGEGEPIILIHGFAMSGKMNWRMSGIADVLAKDFRVIMLDQRGHGHSAHPDDPGAYGVELAHDIARLMDHLEIKKAHICGYSLGGLTTIKFLTLYPDRVISAVVGGFGWQRSDENALSASNIFGHSLQNGIGFGAIVSFLNPNLHSALLASFTDIFVSHCFDVNALGKVILSLNELSVTEEELRKINVPVLSIIGTLDPLKPAVYDLHEILGNHSITEIDDATHRGAVLTQKMKDTLSDSFHAHRSGDPTQTIGSIK